MRIIIPEDYGFYCTQLSPAETGVPIELLAYMNVNNENSRPFLLYYAQNNDIYSSKTVLQPFFFDTGNMVRQNVHEVLLIQEQYNFSPLPPITQESVAKFIERNRPALLAHWRLETSSLKFLSQIRR